MVTNIGKTLIVMSGKGGVGKTTIAVNLAYLLSEQGKKTGLLDADIHGPNSPKMLGIEKDNVVHGRKPDGAIEGSFPFQLKKNLKLMSMAFLIGKDDAVIWRGPMKHNAINNFISDLDWGELDYLVVDLPPGTGDEALSISQLCPGEKMSIIISTPQEVSMMDARRTIDFSRKLDVSIAGLIENMSGGIFGKGNVEKLAQDINVNFLGSISMNSETVASCDSGKPVVSTNENIKQEYEKILQKLIR